MTTLNALVANVTKPTRYISTKDTAKLIRQALKEAFPEIKFSVTSKSYSGGSSIDVSWTEGPSGKQVDAIAKKFQGGSFDGMTDCKGYLSHLLNGEPVQFGGDFVFTSRSIPREKIEAAGVIFAKAEAGHTDRKGGWVVLATKIGMDYGQAWKLSDYAHTAEDFAYYFLHNVDAPAFEGRKSKLADSVTFISDSNDRGNYDA
jgi:hypothetical protein